MNNRHLTDTLVMVRPTHFGFNPETAADNEFQHKLSQTKDEIRSAALAEFELMVSHLRDHDLNVLVLDTFSDSTITPDAVFPNNWFSTTTSGLLITYPMKCQNRKSEVRIDDLSNLLEQHLKVIEDKLELQTESRVLEGTGALVFDHNHGLVYAAISDRCEKTLLEEITDKLQYKVIAFNALGDSGNPIYHTNVMMSVGEGFAVICLETIKDETEREFVRANLKPNQEVIEISYDQMLNMCGNILHVKNSLGEKKIILSQSAYDHFSASQRARLLEYGELIPSDISTIEQVGGGSARCMVAEVFL